MCMHGVYINYIRVCLECILNESNEKKSGQRERGDRDRQKQTETERQRQKV